MHIRDLYMSGLCIRDSHWRELNEYLCKYQAGGGGNLILLNFDTHRSENFETSKTVLFGGGGINHGGEISQEAVANIRSLINSPSINNLSYACFIAECRLSLTYMYVLRRRDTRQDLHIKAFPHDCWHSARTHDDSPLPCAPEIYGSFYFHYALLWKSSATRCRFAIGP